MLERERRACIFMFRSGKEEEVTFLQELELVVGIAFKKMVCESVKRIKFSQKTEWNGSKFTLGRR